jgi:hypothetical protein
MYGESQRKTGTVFEVVHAPVDAVFRYRVRFDDGASGVFFGFELEKIAGFQASGY